MQNQPKPKNQQESHFDEQARKQTEKNVAKAKKYNAEHGLNGYGDCGTGECTGCQSDGECSDSLMLQSGIVKRIATSKSTMNTRSYSLHCSQQRRRECQSPETGEWRI